MGRDENKIIRFTDDDGWRWYEHPDDPSLIAPSVTTVLGCYLNEDDQDYLLSVDKETHRFIMDATSKAGTLIHEECKKFFDEGDNYVAPEKYKKVMKNWAFLVEKHNIRPLEWEVRVFSKRFGYAGEIDLVALMDDENLGLKDQIVLFDIKTGKYKMKAGYQVAAYRQEKVDSGQYMNDQLGCGVIHLHRDGSTRRIYIYKHHDWLFKSFLSALQLCRADYKHKLERMGFKWLYHCPFREYFGLPQLNQGEADAGTMENIPADV